MPAPGFKRTLNQPERLPEAFVAAWNDRSPARIGALFDEGAEFVHVTGLWWHDRASIQQAHAYGPECIFNRSTLSLLETRVKHLAEDIAVVHAKMALRRGPQHGRRARGRNEPDRR